MDIDETDLVEAVDEEVKPVSGTRQALLPNDPRKNDHPRQFDERLRHDDGRGQPVPCRKCHASGGRPASAG